MARYFCSLATGLILAMLLVFPASAQNNSETQTTSSGAALVINIDKSRQRMMVSFDGTQKYDWPVSTGRAGYSTPSGTYAATSMNEIWYSKEWDNSPMPHSIFFIKDGHAIHGSYEVKALGKPVSHGCVRISPANATTLYALVKKHGLKNTRVILTGFTPGGEYKVAKSVGSHKAQPDHTRYENNSYAQSPWGNELFGNEPPYNGSQSYETPAASHYGPRGY